VFIFVENHSTRILEDRPLISEVVVSQLEYNDHREKYMKHILSGMDETQISKHKRCSEALVLYP
jgi:hypothetical protein